MISPEQSFNDLGIDAITGTQMMDWLSLSKIDLGDPTRFSRLKEIIDYFKQFPEDTQRFLIVRATRNKTVDRLTHVWEYAQLLNRRKGYEDMLQLIEKERSVLGENPDPVILSSISSRSLETRESIAKLNSEIGIYES